jgi:hypothetical protein
VAAVGSGWRPWEPNPARAGNGTRPPVEPG